MPRRTLALMFALSFAVIAPAQTPPCGTMEHHAQLLAQYPGIAAAMAGIEAQSAAAIQNAELGADTVYVIPVVVHVVYATTAQNISDAQIQSQIAVLNEDFRRTNADAVNTVPQFQSIAADVEIQFCLATRDPNGQPTNGITRTQTNVSQWSGNDAVKFNSQGGRDAWPRSSYLNIWVCNLGANLLGYAQFPGGPSATDGVVVLYTAFGRTGNVLPGTAAGRTTTHEVGHWMNLRHIWGDNQPNCGDDFVTDTPTANAPHYGCQIGILSCGGTNMVQNYMDYSNDTCMNLFTQGQKNRVRALFSPSGFRESLLSSLGCQGQAPPPATGTFQLNQPASSLTVNATSGTPTGPAITNVSTAQPFTAAFSSINNGAGWDTLISFVAAVTPAQGGYQTPNGQKLNVNLQAPLIALNSGTSTLNLLPFPGNFATNFSTNSVGSYTLQQIVLTPALADGYALSQPCQINVTQGSASCTLNLPSGPTGDDSAVTVNLLGSSGCSVPIPFFGTLYTQFHVSSNGRVTFQQQDTAYLPSITSSLTGRPFLGFWTDLNVASGGSISITRPTSSRFRVAYNAVPYYGQTATVTFAIELDAQTGAMILDGLTGIPANPEAGTFSNGMSQILGLSRGGPSATFGGTTLFGPSLSGTAANSTDALLDYYNAATTFGGLVPSLYGSLNRITFTPAANGNYSYSCL